MKKTFTVLAAIAFTTTLHAAPKLNVVTTITDLASITADIPRRKAGRP